MRVPDVDRTVTRGACRSAARSKARASLSPLTIPVEPPKKEKSNAAKTTSFPKKVPWPVKAASESPVFL